MSKFTKIKCCNLVGMKVILINTRIISLILNNFFVIKVLEFRILQYENIFSCSKSLKAIKMTNMLICKHQHLQRRLYKNYRALANFLLLDKQLCFFLLMLKPLTKKCFYRELNYLSPPS